MCRSKSGIFSLALCLLLLLAICARPCLAEENYVITGSELQQLSGIFERLETLNAKLQSELANSKENLRLLEDELIKLKTDLAELQDSLARSETALTQLSEQLQKARNSLAQAERSFQEYKSAAQFRIKRLTRQRNLLAILAVVLAFI